MDLNTHDDMNIANIEYDHHHHNFEIISDVKFKDVNQVNKLRKQLEERYQSNELRRHQNYPKKTGRSESLHNSLNKGKPIIEFQEKKQIIKVKNQNTIQDTGHSFYGPVQQNQVQQKISSIKDSIASAYLQSESSLSPFIQVYLRQALKLNSKPTNNKKYRQLHQEYSFDSSDSSRINNLVTEGDFVDEFQAKRNPFLAETNTLLDNEINANDTNNTNQQIQKSGSTLKNKTEFIKDKLERMHCISGDYLIESGLKRVKNNLINALTNEQETKNGEDQDIGDELQADHNRYNSKRKYNKYPSRIKTTMDEDFYSNNPNNNNPSFYDYTHKDTNTTHMNTEYNHNFKTEQSDPFQGTRSNTYWSVKVPDQQKKALSNNGMETKKSANQDVEVYIQGLQREQSSKLSKPQRAQSQGPKSGQAIQNLSYNADPNNSVLKDYFGQVDNINMNNIFVNQLGITEEQKNQMIDKMDPDTRNKIQQKFLVQDKISKYARYNNNQFDEFQQSFQNNFQFIEDEQKKLNEPESSGVYATSQKNGNSSDRQQFNKRSISIGSKRTPSINQAAPEVVARFKTPINMGKLATYSRLKTESDSYTDFTHGQQVQTKKEYPLYINRVNRVRLQSFSSSKHEQKKQQQFSSAHKSTIDNSYTQNNENISSHLTSFIDPRKIYRQNLENYSASKNQFDKNKISNQLISVIPLKNLNQSDGFSQKVFFQNQDLKKKLHTQNIKSQI